MKHSFLFKRRGYYHVEYFDELENRIKRTSTGCKKKSDAMQFLSNFDHSRKPKTTFILLQEFFDLYNSHLKANLSKAYLKDNQFTQKYFIEFAGNIPIVQVNTLLLNNFISSVSIRSKYLSIKHFGNLRSAFNKAISWGYLQVNPILKIKPTKPTKNNPLFINETELGKILEKEVNPNLRNAYKFAFYTGMRLGEIVNLKWQAVNLPERIINVQNTESFTTKGRQERIVPINEILYNVLLNQMPKLMTIDKDQYVFNNNGFKYNHDFISKRFKKALRQTELNSKLHFHDLRHSFASNLVMKGVPLYTVMQLLGHKEFKTTQIYSHLKVESLRNAVKLLEY